MSSQGPLAEEHSIRLSNPSGSSAQIAFQGASVFSFIPADGQERLFKSGKSPLSGPKPVRGGIPIVWPVFGPPPKEAPFEKVAQHGFARNVKWEYVKGSDPSQAIMTLKPTADIEQIYEPDFELTYTVKLVGSDTLETELRVTNPSSAVSTLDFHTLFHTYFQLPAGVLPSDVRIAELDGKQYKDRRPGHDAMHTDEVFTYEGETDRLYTECSGRLTVQYGDSPYGLVLETTKLGDLVTWNPHAEKGATMSDLDDDGWKRFVGIEPGHTTDFVKVQPGESWVCTQKIVGTKRES